MNIKMLSIDSSTSCSGICDWINGKYKKSYSVSTEKKITGDNKLNQMISLLYKELKKEKPDIILIELVSVTRNALGTRMLQELTGAIRGYCIDNNIEYVAIRPTEWRSAVVKAVGIKPNGRKRVDQKKWAIDIVNNYLKIKTESDDEAEAILLGFGYIQMCGGEND